MKLTNKQIKDLDCIKWFVPFVALKNPIITAQDEFDFINFSDKGIEPKEETPGYQALKEGKRWRGIHMQMYEDGMIEGSVPYMVLLEGMPDYVVDFLKKEMFKGVDAGIIDACYKELCGKPDSLVNFLVQKYEIHNN